MLTLVCDICLWSDGVSILFMLGGRGDVWDGVVAKVGAGPVP